MVRFTFEDICSINFMICEYTQEPYGVKENLLNSALSVYDSYFDKDKEILAALIRSLVKNHCFINGNKRTAFAVGLMSGIQFSIDHATFKEIIKLISVSNFSVEEIEHLIFDEH